MTFLCLPGRGFVARLDLFEFMILRIRLENHTLSWSEYKLLFSTEDTIDGTCPAVHRLTGSFAIVHPVLCISLTLSQERCFYYSF